MLQGFKSDDSSSPRGSVEGCYSGIFLNLNCLLHDFRYSFWGIDLAMHVLDKFARGLVVSSATAHFRVLWPPGTLCLNILTYLYHTAKLGVSWLVFYA